MQTDTYFQKISVQEKNTFDEAGCLDELSLRERKRYNSLHPSKRNDYAAARGALKELLAGRYGGQPTSYEILSRANGSPYVAEMPSVYCSISHSKNHVAVLVGTRPACGIDVEEKVVRNIAFSRYIMTTEEAEMLQNGSFPAEWAPTVAWCAKEAAFKAAQKGKSITEYSVIAASGDEIVLKRKNLRFCIFIKISDNYIYAHGYQC